MSYLVLKWIHILAIISWMAGILYLYRILVYIKQNAAKPEVLTVLAVMGQRLYKYITMPALGISIITGTSIIIVMPDFANDGWLHIKITTVIALMISSFYGGKLLRRGIANPATLPSVKALKILNEVPTLLMAIIVAMVIFKPFVG